MPKTLNKVVCSEHNTQFQLLANMIPQLVWMADKDGWIYWYNDQWFKYTGTTLKEMEGWGWQSVHDPKTLPAVMEKWKLSIETGNAFEMVFPLKGADNVFRPFLTRIAPIRDQNGSIVNWFGTNTDISAQYQAEMDALNALSLEEMERIKLLTMIENIPNFIGMSDLDGHLQYLNRAAKQLIGLTVNQDISTFKLYDLYSPTALRRIQGEGMPTLLENGIWRTEMSVLHRDGHEIPVSQTITLYRDKTDIPLGLGIIIEDITEHKKLETTQQQLLEKLTRSNNELERFAYVASHDMQEPLRMISSFSQLIDKEYQSKLDASGHEYLDFIKNAALRMKHMVSDLLEYARVKNDETHFETFSMEVEMQHVLENLSTIIDESHAMIKHEKLPTLIGNPFQIMSLMQNLIGNGIKYQKKGHQPKIDITFKDQKSYWCFTVHDNGIGIDTEFIDKIFEPFKRLHSWDEYQGTGMGLALCKKIVEIHRGKIWVTSKPGLGSQFHFTLPKKIVNKSKEKD